MGMNGFNAQDYDTDTQGGNYVDLNEGTYRLEVTKAEWHQQAKGGKGINLIYEVVEPEEFKGGRIFDYINFEHSNPVAQKIGHESLAKLCRATEFEPENEPDEMLYKSFVGTVRWGKPSEKRQDDGSVKKYDASLKVVVFHYPDAGELPELGEDPSGKPRPLAAGGTSAPANDNRPAANDNARSAAAPAAAAAKPAGARPWKKTA